MSKARFNVTYDIVTQESAEDGDFDESGMIARGATLREAVKAVRQTRTNRVDGVEAVEAQGGIAGYHVVTIINGMEFETGAYESRSLHIGPDVTPASAARIVRLVRNGK
jgi:hypothetical protein